MEETGERSREVDSAPRSVPGHEGEETPAVEDRPKGKWSRRGEDSRKNRKEGRFESRLQLKFLTLRRVRSRKRMVDMGVTR